MSLADGDPVPAEDVSPHHSTDEALRRRARMDFSLGSELEASR